MRKELKRLKIVDDREVCERGFFLTLNAPTPNARTSVIVVIVIEAPACRSASPTFSGSPSSFPR